MIWLGAILIILSLPLFIGGAINKDAGSRYKLGGLLLGVGLVIAVLALVTGM